MQKEIFQAQLLKCLRFVLHSSLAHRLRIKRKSAGNVDRNEMCLFLSAFFCTAWLTNCCVLGTKSTWESGVILWNGSSYCSTVSGQTHSCQLLDQSSVELVQGKCLASRGRKPAAMSISTLCWPSKNTSSIQGCSVPALFAGGNYWKMPSKGAENGTGGNEAEVEMHLCFEV